MVTVVCTNITHAYQKAFYHNDVTLTGRWITGVSSIDGHEEVFRQMYDAHTENVLTYFEPHRFDKDFMLFDLEQDDDDDISRRLHTFLGLDTNHHIRYSKVRPPERSPATRYMRE